MVQVNIVCPDCGKVSKATLVISTKSDKIFEGKCACSWHRFLSQYEDLAISRSLPSTFRVITEQPN